MFLDRSLAVVVPCHNEQVLIRKVIETMPETVDRIFVVDDQSTDNTATVVQECVDRARERVVLIRHEENQGVGGAIATGYKAALAERFDVTVVMAGDAQMDPAELPAIVGPVARGECDYTKGNRLFSGEAWEMIPRVRYLGNAMLSLLTKIASGYWHVADSQSGYTAISLRALETIDWDKMYKRYGQPNDLLVRLNIHGFRVQDVPIRPIYGIGEQSGIRPLRMIPRLSLLLHRLFWYRMLQKYVIRDFHPLLFFYTIGLMLFTPGLLFGIYLFLKRVVDGPVVATSALFAMFLFITGLQLLLFAMWMDMENNRHLR
ncbi:ribonuclease BN [Thiohalocapsa halophila]|uniref:Ribonuclease BN n=1 Tax=Thiohalocapsa halophila TaxID=69359 RepID=A0ABS1CK77_9GAMM|nr:glycosyltransferase family 2 protein [Thiohalocapsa halophila]MBK1632330.1 ribonuclease BN [Thiohalocapsa halophila]